VLGAYLRANPDKAARAIIATKWGGSYEREVEGGKAFQLTRKRRWHRLLSGSDGELHPALQHRPVKPVARAGNATNLRVVCLPVHYHVRVRPAGLYYRCSVTVRLPAHRPCLAPFSTFLQSPPLS